MNFETYPTPTAQQDRVGQFFSQDIREAGVVRFHLICKVAGLANINMLISFQKTNQVPCQNNETYMGFYKSVILLISI